MFNVSLTDDATRVILANGSDGDYINANYINMEIPGSGIINRYIATQGSKEYMYLIVLCRRFGVEVGRREILSDFRFSCISSRKLTGLSSPCVLCESVTAKY